MQWAKNIVDTPWFNNTITAVIVLNAIVIGMDTSETLTQAYGAGFAAAN